MTDYRRVFIDTSPFIYFIEKDINNPSYSDAVKHFLHRCRLQHITLITSVITEQEYLVWPYRHHQHHYVRIFEDLLRTLAITILPIDRSIARLAARIRADYPSFKAMDALQLACASRACCDAFLTNDRQLLQYTPLACILVQDL